MKFEIIQAKEFSRIMSLDHDFYEELAIISDMCRANTLTMVKNAGSGHLGSSFSSMDIVVWLYYKELNTIEVGFENPNRDIYFSSKGHDVPGLYSVLFSLGILTQEQILKLRRIDGLDGHPDIRIRGIEANSGSLGMGKSKGRGMAWAKRKLRQTGDVYVMTGDGEFQEGQNYEALQSCVQQKITNLTVIMDHNKVQSDKPVDQIISLGDLEGKIKSFGWHVVRVNGHDFSELDNAFRELKAITDKPKFIIADTIKGKGVSFMEHPSAMKSNHGLYPWHAGAPDDESFIMAFNEITCRIDDYLNVMGYSPIIKTDVQSLKKNSNSPVIFNSLGEPVSSAAPLNIDLKKNSGYVVEAFGKALLKEGIRRQDIVVLDADLSSDCRLRYFENAFPDRFIENGIAEQDMVSMAGGLAKMGFLPVVNSFAGFLASRANEQIYNNCTEKHKIIYACHYAGLIPSGPGKSHQSIRDISLLGALPNMEIIQPCNPIETEMVVDYCINVATQNCAIRMNICPSPREISLPDLYQLNTGKESILREGRDALIFAYGPVMLHEALCASESLEHECFELEVINMPWLNVVDLPWLEKVILGHNPIFVLEDHARYGGLGEFLISELTNSNLLEHNNFSIFAIDDFPACGSPTEALNFHGLDGESIAHRILILNHVEQNCI
ncbi:MAG: transketolase C-terminal domain-containing protein [Bacteroidota bacterium]